MKLKEADVAPVVEKAGERNSVVVFVDKASGAACIYELPSPATTELYPGDVLIENQVVALPAPFIIDQVPPTAPVKELLKF